MHRYSTKKLTRSNPTMILSNITTTTIEVMSPTVMLSRNTMYKVSPMITNNTMYKANQMSTNTTHKAMMSTYTTDKANRTNIDTVIKARFICVTSRTRA